MKKKYYFVIFFLTAKQRDGSSFENTLVNN